MSWSEALQKLENFTFAEFDRPPSNEEIRKFKQDYWSVCRKEYNKTYLKRRITVTFSHSELAQVKQAAAKHGKPPATFCRESLTAHVNNEKVIPLEIAKGLQKLTLEIRRIGNNINQIAKTANTAKFFDRRPNKAAVQKQLKELDQKVAKFVKNQF